MFRDRSCGVFIKNDTGAVFRFQVLHQYTGDAVEDSNWHELAAGEERMVFIVHYRTGALTTGVDNWIVNGIEKKRVTAGMNVPGMGRIETDGFIDLRWFSGRGAGSDWKVHTLRPEDDTARTDIIVRGNNLEFVSPSGRSSTSWNPEYEII